MNYKRFIILLLTLFILSSCASTKKMSNEDFYNHTWELEYITGPRIAFEGFFPDQKPFLKFEKIANLVTGNSGCNGYSSDYEIDGNSLKFGEKGVSTLMYCGEGEQLFINMLKKIDSYSIDSDGNLNLLMNEISMMRFHKK